MDRPSWNDYFKEITLATLKRSPCDRLQVGCLLVLENRRLIIKFEKNCCLIVKY